MVAPKHVQKIERLIDLAGRSWIDSELESFSRFRLENSPKDLWSHRRPKTSPLIPLVYAYRNPSRHYQEFSLGYWFGDPIIQLAQIAEQIFLFEDYWDNLPDGRGKNNIQKLLLRRASRFSGFIHELTVATHFAMQQDVEVEPAFFDPSSNDGEPDIWVSQGKEKIGIQCKSRSPIDAMDLSFDGFQYLAGLFIRLVEDGTRNLRLEFSVNQKLTNEIVNGIGKQIKGLVNDNLALPWSTKQAKYGLGIQEIDTLGQEISEKLVARFVNDAKANNFVFGAGVNCSSPKGTCKNIAIVSVTGTKPLDFIPWVVQTARKAAASSPANTPMILALHEFGTIDFTKVVNQAAGSEIEQQLKSTFSKHTNVHSLSISCDYRAYSDAGSQGSAPQIPHVDCPNPYFVMPIQVNP